MRSEGVKLWSLIATRGVVAALVLLPIVLGAVRVLPVPVYTDELAQRDGTPILFEAIALSALPVAFLAAILGVIAMSSEYAADVLSGSLTAVPRRWALIVAKVAPAMVLAFLTSITGSSAAAWIAFVTLDSRGYLAASLRETTVVILSVAGGSVLFAILGIAAAAVSRSTAVAVLIVLGTVFLLPRLVLVVAGEAGLRLIDWLPASALQAMTTHEPAQAIATDMSPASSLTPGEGFLSLLVASVFALGLSIVIFSRRRLHSVIGAERVRKLLLQRRRLRERPLRSSFAGVLRSESLKAFSTPAVRWLLALSWVANVWLACQWAGSSTPEQQQVSPLISGDLELLTFSQVNFSIAAGLTLSHLLIAGVGAIIATADFSTGTIRPALTAVPHRGRLVLAKVIVSATATLIVMATSLIVAAPLVVVILQRQGYIPSLAEPIVALSIISGTLSLVLTAVIGCGVGIVVRSAAGTLLAIAATFIVFPYLLSWLQEPTARTPFVWFANISQLFPDPVEAAWIFSLNSSYQVFDEDNRMHFYSEQDMPMLVLWALGAVLLGWLRLRRRGV
ncbi:hypothetical protein I6E74_08880 [Salinibacterium sp. SWN139]|uniref:hypothetical protein n=1 Tax=Salinibacterium sp. SWN139 TaxID=2792055 RepID=UPI0018CCE09B|nr:hypothetical protein [Salinibacterium sp. SWN139]MBH0054280.1 hypothetical protein [Salinibacterium sp. SWN139]